MTLSPGAVLKTLWLAWIAYWIVASRSASKAVESESAASRLLYALPAFTGAALLFSDSGFGLSRLRLIPQDDRLGWACAALAAAGLSFAVWARLTLGHLWSGRITLKADHRIVRAGPYGVTRHPIYTGVLLALIGSTLAQGTVLALAGLALLIAAMALKIRREERLLLAHFGDAYRAYQREVPALVPRPAKRRALDWPPSQARAFFDAAGPVIEAFAREHNLKIEKWFKDIPAWALHFRHPRGGVGQLVVEPGESGGASLQSCRWRDNYAAQARRLTWGKPVQFPVSELASRLTAALERVLAWTDADLGEPNFMPQNAWHRAWTKEQFERLDLDYPAPNP